MICTGVCRSRFTTVFLPARAVETFMTSGPVFGEHAIVPRPGLKIDTHRCGRRQTKKRREANLSTFSVNCSVLRLRRTETSSPGRTRTYDIAVNSRSLYQLSYRGSVVCGGMPPDNGGSLSFDLAGFKGDCRSKNHFRAPGQRPKRAGRFRISFTSTACRTPSGLWRSFRSSDAAVGRFRLPVRASSISSCRRPR